jgi:hypothetical protein
MDKGQPWFVEERAIALASLLLTSRKDLVVTHVPAKDHEYDLLVELVKDHHPWARLFAVQVAGVLELPSVQDIEAKLRKVRPKPRQEYSLPLAAFLWDVRRNEGFFTWIVQPVIQNGAPKLDGISKQDWHKLDESAVNKIVEQVNAYYDALMDQLKIG